MKILVIGLDGAAPEILFGDERLTHFRRLMEFGCYGRLESIIPPVEVPAWICMATSQDPGSLGVYGVRNRKGYSYNNLEIVTSRSVQERAIWDQVAREKKKAIIIGVPPSYPPRKLNGICVGCFLTPDTHKDIYTYPAGMKKEITKVVGEYPVDVKGFCTEKKHQLKNEIYTMSRKHFEVVRHFLKTFQWDYFQFVEIGLDRLQHGFWEYHDPQHVLFEIGNPYEEVIRNYYLYLDDELRKILEILSEDTIILVASDHGAQRIDGCFCVNEWLVKEGLLVLNDYPKEITPFSKLNVNWEKTKVWCEEGYYAQVFFNVMGREPQGIIQETDYERFRDEVKAKLETMVDEKGNTLEALVFKPEEIYQRVCNVAPDLMVCFGGLYGYSIGSVGHPGIYLRGNDTGSERCKHTQFGSFILASPNNPLHGEVKGAHLLDLSPTLLELGGYDIPGSMQRKSLVTGKMLPTKIDTSFSTDEEEGIRERLKGLGYIS